VTPERDVDVLVDDAVREWEARWNETGTHLAVWVADDDDPEIGRLALYAVDARTDRIDPDRPLMSGELARPGFAIGDGNLAWATPPDGQDGKGPHVKVVAWTKDGIGKVETKPAGDVLVVQR
jgi:hypothetical protein